MKRFLLIISLTAVLLQTFSKGLILLSFEVNRDFIAQNLCVQKTSRNNCCKGSCQLKKQLNDDDKKEQSLPAQNQKDKSEVVLFCELQADPLSFVTTLPSGISLFGYCFPVSFDETTIPHPPPQLA